MSKDVNNAMSLTWLFLTSNNVTNSSKFKKLLKKQKIEFQFIYGLVDSFFFFFLLDVYRCHKNTM